MKIAILYSGTIRNLTNTINNNIDYFEKNSNDIDLYFSIWDHIGYSNNINSPDYILTNRLLDGNTVVTEDLIKSIIPKNVNIKKIKIETYNTNNYNFNLTNGCDNANLAAQYYKVSDCCNLLDNSIEYDIIVRLRCDILLQNKIDNNLLFNLVKNNKIIFPSKIWYNLVRQNDSHMINEMVWISNKDLMKKACNIYNNAQIINKIINERKLNYKNYGENICFMNLEAENMVESIYLFDFDYNVLR